MRKSVLSSVPLYLSLSVCPCTESPLPESMYMENGCLDRPGFNGHPYLAASVAATALASSGDTTQNSSGLDECIAQDDIPVISVRRADTLFSKMVNMIGGEFLPDDRDRKYYADSYTCCPPPLFILFVTICQVSVTGEKCFNDICICIDSLHVAINIIIVVVSLISAMSKVDKCCRIAGILPKTIFDIPHNILQQCVELISEGSFLKSCGALCRLVPSGGNDGGCLELSTAYSVNVDAIASPLGVVRLHCPPLTSLYTEKNTHTRTDDPVFSSIRLFLQRWSFYR